MTRDRRGFEYALEPLRNVTDWDMTDAAVELAAQNVEVNSQQNKVTKLSTSLSLARSEVISQRQYQTVLHINVQRLAHAYMLQIQKTLILATRQLTNIEKERDKTLYRLNELRKLAESLDRNKEQAVEEYDQSMTKLMAQQADDNWLQRLHQKKAP